MTADKSRVQLANFLTSMDHGEYFDKITGNLDESMGLEYFKATSWVFDPIKKGPLYNPRRSNFEHPANYKTYEDEFFSIDGEKHPA